MKSGKLEVVVCLVCLAVSRVSGTDVQALLEMRIAEQEKGKLFTATERAELIEAVYGYLDVNNAKYSNYLDRWPAAEQARCLLIYAKISAIDPLFAHRRLSRFPSVKVGVQFLQKDPAFNKAPFGLYAIVIGEYVSSPFGVRDYQPTIDAYRQLRNVSPYLADCMLHFMRHCPASRPFIREVTVPLLDAFASPVIAAETTTNTQAQLVSSALANAVSLPPMDVFAETVSLSNALSRTRSAEIVILNLMSEKGSADAAYSSYLWSLSQIAYPVSNCGWKLPRRTVQIFTVVCQAEEQPLARAFCAGLLQTNKVDDAFPFVCLFSQGTPAGMMRGQSQLKASSPEVLQRVEDLLRTSPPAAK